jgi:O-antigen ligase
MPKFGILPKGETMAPREAIARAAPNGNAAARTPALVATPAGVSPQLPYEVAQGGFSLPMLMATILIVLDFGRPFDEFLTGYHIPVVICLLGGVFMLFTRWTPALRTRIGKALMLFTAMLCVSSVFSIWRVGSLTFLAGFVEVDIILFFILAAVPTTIGQVRWLAVAIVFATSLLFIVGTMFDESGRLILKDFTVGNSDDVALFAGFCIPLIILFAQRLNKFLGIVVGLAGIGGCLMAVELSGTRFALVALAVLGLYYFTRAGAAQKVLLLICFTLVAIGSLVLLPKNIISRFSTIGSVVDDQAQAAAGGKNEAIASTAARKDLFFDGIHAFIKNPIVGVGPSQFINWRPLVLGKHGQPTHNTYVQVAAEEGIGGIVFYLAFLIAVFGALRRCLKPFEGWADGRQLATALTGSLVYFVTSAITLTCDLHVQGYAIAGLAIALDRIREQQLAGAELPVTEGTQNSAKLPPVSRPLVKPLPPRIDQASAPGRPIRYRFNRPVASRND